MLQAADAQGDRVDQPAEDLLRNFLDVTEHEDGSVTYHGE